MGKLIIILVIDEFGMIVKGFGCSISVLNFYEVLNEVCE